MRRAEEIGSFMGNRTIINNKAKADGRVGPPVAPNGSQGCTNKQVAPRLCTAPIVTGAAKPVLPPPETDS